MDEKLSADILAVCNTLGYSGDGKYYLNPQCLDSGKALLLYMRRDTSQHDTRQLLGETKIMQNDLIPIYKLKECKDELSEIILRLMVNLTYHPLALYQHGLPKNKKYRNHYDIITRHLQAYKIAFVDVDFWSVIFSQLKKLIADMDLLLESQKMNVERMLVLIRNVLQVPADPKEEMRNDDDASVHDQLLWSLQSAGIMDLILFMSASETTQEFCMYAIEIITLSIREHDAKQLAKATQQRSVEEKIKEARELTHTLNTERLDRSRKHTSARNFGGTFVVRGLIAPSGNEQICYKPVQTFADLTLDNSKKTRRTAVNRRQDVEPTNTRRSTLTMRLLLQEFCVEFLNRAYNNLMSTVKDNLSRYQTQENDDTYYLQTLTFFMEFNRFYNFDISLVSSTMTKDCFHYVHGLVDKYHDMMVTDKDNLKLWSKRAHIALQAYQELLATLCEMEKHSSTRESSRSLQASIVYMAEYRELCFSLLNTYDSGKLSRNYLCDLVDTNHLFLRMLENFTKEKTVLVVPRIKRRRSTKKKNKSRKKNKRTRRNSSGSWMVLEEKLTEFLANPFEPEQVIPFDAASDIDVEEQTGTAKNRIATHLSLEEFSKAVSLLRAAKEVWPNDNQLSMENEISSLKSIFLDATLLPDAEVASGHSSNEEAENEQEEEDDEEEAAAREEATAYEHEFDFRGFVERYATVKVVSNLANLLKHFRTLPELTLHAILKMFHRFVFDLKIPGLICQASIFQTFQDILRLAPVRFDLKEASEFIIHFWPKFVKLADSNPKIFLEILFWKNLNEAIEIQEGYSNHDSSMVPLGRRKKSKGSRRILTPEEENEVIVLAKEYLALPEKEIKQVDWINEKLINGPKVKKTITNFLEEKGLLFKKQRKRGTGSTRRKKQHAVENGGVSDVNPLQAPHSSSENDGSDKDEVWSEHSISSRHSSGSERDGIGDQPNTEAGSSFNLAEALRRELEISGSESETEMNVPSTPTPKPTSVEVDANDQPISKNESSQRHLSNKRKSRLVSVSSDSDQEDGNVYGTILELRSQTENESEPVAKSVSRILSDSDSESEDLNLESKNDDSADPTDNVNGKLKSKNGKGKPARLIYSDSDSE